MPTKRPKTEHNVVIYRYSTILSYIMERFLDDFDEGIERANGDVYLFTTSYKVDHLISAFFDYVDDFFSRSEDHPYGLISTVVVSSGYPHHSWLNEFKKDFEEDDRRLKIVKSKLLLRYVMSDRKFRCDESELNKLFETLFTTYMTGKRFAITPNYNTVTWVGCKSTSEFDMVKIIKSCHTKGKIYPRHRKNLITDLNDMVYDQLRKTHRIPDMLTDQVVMVYELAREACNGV